MDPSQIIQPISFVCYALAGLALVGALVTFGSARMTEQAGGGQSEAKLTAFVAAAISFAAAGVLIGTMAPLFVFSG